ncbi:putative spermidine/putrescine transport system ATP-binding protein [Stella humosa]|uniref:Putative spermidine/putrescine transport system ATP-binding protein n=1 Tax=Stella humosa TaxID=94 RepID=A0A3N1KR53_9PROT|nr:ABC transporter ATP-binding protein [Stella humosa]ROP83131.1 putative spermidine/putrescine transport system ATP-binding protein [Stella humosa]BBK30092.1 spermidine/putrescine ABC transporter ATPase [Stella humosa]
MRTSDTIVRLDRLQKRYGTVVAVEEMSLAVPRGELLCLLGPSGCGKTTTLKMIAGFVPPSGGRILIDESDVTGVPAHRRDTGMVFQNYALFPHLTVAENIAFAPRNVGMKRDETRRRVDELLELVQLGGLARRYPAELSGGQQQRVALARALALRPAVLLLDEPLSNLDARLRMQMRDELRGLVSRLGTTTLLVTHDQEEALAMADRIVVMNKGAVEQIGSPDEIYERPTSRFVAEFIGRCNLLPVRPGNGGVVLADGTGIAIDGPVPADAGLLAVRPEHVTLAVPGSTALVGRVIRAVYHGAVTHLYLDAAGTEILADIPSAAARSVPTGTAVGIVFDPGHIRILP